jgi:hypothetical protein
MRPLNWQKLLLKVTGVVQRRDSVGTYACSRERLPNRAIHYGHTCRSASENDVRFVCSHRGVGMQCGSAHCIPVPVAATLGYF